MRRKITYSLPEYKQALRDFNFSWLEVKANLDKNAAAVEFIRFHYYDRYWTDNIYYAALILRSEYEHPKMVLLGTEKELNKILSAAKKEGIASLYARSVDKSKEASSGGNYGATLYDFVWSKTDSLLAGVETVYYSPAGNLHQIAFAGVPLPDDTGYLGEKYALHCLGTTRQVVSGVSNPLAPKEGEWLLAGGINYDDEPMQPAGVQTDTTVFTFNPTIYVADRSGQKDLPYLPGTQQEVKAISDILQDKDTKIAHKVLTENQAVEEYFHNSENFKNTSVIHIGTHGYFSPAPKTAKERQEREMMQLEDSPFHQIDHPLLRSGLFLSGSNKAWTTRETYPGRMDGIWTAQEITELNLRHLKLATLSACETALGDIEGNEGVFGLQRAFKAAGVEKMLVSLWKVDDAATSLYMQTFYKNWLSGGGIYEAYRATQEEMKADEEYGNPYYWAGFVLLE